jgi:hypothetical protein
MPVQIRTVAFAACIATLWPVGAPTAQAKQCSVAPTSNPQGHWWSWRLIDGRKCWYEGKNMISKSLLQWPAQASAQPKSDGGPVSVLTQEPNNPLDSQAWVPDDADDTFESRWRARAMNN